MPTPCDSAITIAPSGPTPSPIIAARNVLYFPIIATTNAVAACFGDQSALDFYRLLMADERQQRGGLACCPALVEAARFRAAGLAAGDPWGHVDSAGRWPNEHARMAGCHLPAHYAEQGNNIESLVAGSPDVTAVFDALARSDDHADHLFGRNDFFRAQTHVGIGMAAGGEFSWYWVILIAICEVPTGGE
jgi:hypothetical protein